MMVSLLFPEAEVGLPRKLVNLNQEPFLHCYGHALNLAACDTSKQSKIMKDALELTHEITY